jgi:hypothetical protein
VNLGLSPPIKGFSQRFLDDETVLFTLRLMPLSHFKTAALRIETLAQH